MIYMEVTYAACISLHREQLSCCCLWFICFCIHWFQKLDSVCGDFCLIRTSNIMQLLRDHLAPPSSEVLFQLCKVLARSPWGTIITRSLLRGWILALWEPSHRLLNSNRHNLFSWFMSPTRNMRQKQNPGCTKFLRSRLLIKTGSQDSVLQYYFILWLRQEARVFWAHCISTYWSSRGFPLPLQ